MDTRAKPTHLGQNILIVMESTPSFLDALRTFVVSLPQVTDTFFTLLCCHPTQYWEHGGADNPEVQEQIEKAWKAEDEEFDRAKICLDQARAILQDAGIPVSHILTKTALEVDSLVTATMHELSQRHYTGVIVSRYHTDIVNRLLRKGLTDIFRAIPQVEVWALDLAM
jgi:hypothetical protein